MTLCHEGVLRIAALPYRELLTLAPPRTREYVQKAVEAAQVMEHLQPRLEVVLHAAVPTSEPIVRRVLLQLGRDIHNRRYRMVDGKSRALALGSLLTEDSDCLAKWIDASSDAAAALAAAEAELKREILTHTRDRLHALTRQEAFLRPMALASAALAKQLAQPIHPNQRPQSSKLERSLLAYLQRAAAKTSPFSTFMYNALCTFDASHAGESIDIAGATRSSVAYVNRGAHVRLAEATFAAHGWKGQSTLDFSPELVWQDDGTVEVPRFVYNTFSGRLWRQYKVTRFRLRPEVAACLRNLPSRLSGARIVEELTTCGLSMEAAAALVTRFIAAQLLRTVVAVDAYTLEPGHQLGDPLGLDEIAAAMANSDASTRNQLVGRAEIVWQAAWNDLPIERPQSLALVHEDAHIDGEICLGGGVVSALAELPAALAAHVVEQPAHAAARTRFLECFGNGGVCPDLRKFLQDLSARPPEPPANSTTRRPDGNERPLAICAFVQIADLRDREGELLVVVNQLYTGGVALSARFAAGSSDFHIRLTRSLRNWLVIAHAPAEPIDVPLCGDINPLQAHPRLTDRVLMIDGEPVVDTSAALTLDQLVLHHDVTTNQLAFRDHHTGRPIAPTYLGATLLGPAFGPIYWLSVLAQPYQVSRTNDDVSMPPSAETHRVYYYPRRRLGSVVLQRARWWVHRVVLGRWLASRGAHRLFEIRRACQTHGMPRLVYVRAPITHPITFEDRDAHKPLWIDTENPFFLDLLEAFSAHHEWICFTEALPDGDCSVVTMDGERHAAEFVIECSI